MFLRARMLVGLLLATMLAPVAAQEPAEDPFLWLEEIHGERALAWARAETARTEAALQADPRYADFHARALAVAQTREEVGALTLRPDGLYQFHQDAAHPRGLIRRTTLARFAAARPAWEIVLNLDALNASEHADWFYRGMDCLPPEEARCLVRLSEGGGDPVVVREYDLRERRFVPGGFSLPAGKQTVAWEDRDTLLVVRDWGPGTTTAAGFGFILKRLRRNQALAEAQELFRGEASDYSAGIRVLRDGGGHVQASFALRGRSLGEISTFLLTDRGPIALNWPARVTAAGVVDGRLLVSLRQPWQAFSANTLISFDLEAWRRAPDAVRADLVWAAGPRQRLGEIVQTRGQLVITYLDNIRARAIACDYRSGAWQGRPIGLPDNAMITVGEGSSKGSDQVLFTVEDFLSPPALWLRDGASLRRIRSADAAFDGTHHVVEQLEAVSRDGTHIPYFLIRPRQRPGPVPTLLYGYGGFGVPQIPSYNPMVGRLWLAQGNAYVVANIRGGGEFGLDWHQSAVRGNRQRAFDDYLAVAEDLIRRGVTSPRRLGAIGGSNGGLLVGAAITQRPELFNAAILEVPILDMLRYHLIGAGPSWLDEYGDPRLPEERAWLAAYSPYQRLTAGRVYPAPFIITALSDDRLTPVHGRKAAARLAALGMPYFYYEAGAGGHELNADSQETAQRMALEYVYASRRLVD